MGLEPFSGLVPEKKKAEKGFCLLPHKARRNAKTGAVSAGFYRRKKSGSRIKRLEKIKRAEKALLKMPRQSSLRRAFTELRTAPPLPKEEGYPPVDNRF
ncbi:MAG TPA: hypothetical protein DF364_01830, partial [Ruminococcaceae bacterium]|nr:hypothetical protein [Oscillospiraceae bacterium]